MEKLNVLTVNYKSKEFIDNLIKKLNNENVDYELIVVNNSEESFNDIANDNLLVVKNNLKIKNACLSHVSGLNIGLSNLNFDNKYTLICDPDISFSKGVISKMIEYMKHRGLDIIGISKITKGGKILKYPYIWFTIIKTEHLEDFYFLYLPIKDNLLVKVVRKFCRIMRILPNIEDSGDSIYELIYNNNLKYETIKPINKKELPENYRFLNKINSLEYIWEEYLISHFNCGSSARYNRIHRNNDKNIFFML